MSLENVTKNLHLMKLGTNTLSICTHLFHETFSILFLVPNLFTFLLLATFVLWW